RHLAHHTVARVCDVDAARRVERDSGGMIEARGGSSPVEVAGLRAAAASEGRDSTIRRARADLVVPLIADVDDARTIHEHAARLVEPRCRTAAVLIALRSTGERGDH